MSKPQNLDKEWFEFNEKAFPAMDRNAMELYQAVQQWAERVLV